MPTGDNLQGPKKTGNPYCISLRMFKARAARHRRQSVPPSICRGATMGIQLEIVGILSGGNRTHPRRDTEKKDFG